MNKHFHGWTKLLCLAGCAACLTGGAVALATAQTGTVASAAGEWHVVNPLGEGVWTEEGGTLTNAKLNDNSLKNFFVKEDPNAVGNYSVTAHFQIESNPVAPNANAQFGIVPWYKDENNYLMFNLWWREESWCGGNGNVLCNATLQGKQNGEDVHIYKSSGNFEATTFSDVWVWSKSNLSALHKPINDSEGWTVQVIKRVSDSSISSDFKGDIIEIRINNISCGFYTTDLTAPYRTEAQSVGVSARNVTGLTVTDFTVATSDWSTFNYPYSDYDYNPLTGSGLIATGKSWAYDGATQKATGSGIGNHVEQNVVTPVNAVKKVDPSFNNYAVEGTVENIATAEDGGYAGLAVWYEDYENYLNAGIELKNGSRVAVIDGKLAGVAVHQTGETISESGAVKLSAEKLGSTIILRKGGEEICRYVASSALANKFTGYALKNASAEFTGLNVVSKEYEAYAEYVGTLDGKEYILASKALSDFTAREGKVSIDSRTFEKAAYALLSRDTFGKTETSVTVTPSATESGYYFGVVGWYQNANDFIYGVLNGTKATIYRHSAEEETELASEDHAYTPDGAIVLSMVVEDGKVTFRVGGEDVVTATVSGLEADQGKHGGFLAKGVSLSATHPVFDGWRPYTPFPVDDWIYSGPEIDTWTRGEGDTFTAEVAVSGGGSRNSTYALTEIDKESDYWMYGNIHVSQFGEEWERRVGFFPWYIDNNNWVAVYASHIPGNNPEIVVDAKVNGVSLGMKWDAYRGVFALLDTDVILEVHVGTDSVEIYNGRGRDAIYTYAVTGLAEAAEGKTVMVGFHAMNADVTFSNMKVADTMQSVNKVAPTIEVVGTVKTTGKVGETIVMPALDIQDDLGETIKAVFKVLDPDGNEVSLTGSRFVPEKAGEYKVTITATDSWGNEATPYTYTITVSAAASTDPTTPGGTTPGGTTPGGTTDPETPGEGGEDDGGCGSVISVSALGVTAGLIALTAVLVLRKKRNDN